MMTKYNVQIHLDKPQRVFFNGETIRGQVYLCTTERLRFKNIQVAIIGKGYVKWYDPIHKWTWRANKPYVNQSQIVCPDVELDLGNYCYHFEFTLPEHLPPSYEHSNAKIRYHILTTLGIPRGLDKKLIKTISVLRHMNLEKWPGLKVNVETSDEKQFFSGIFKSGSEVVTSLRIAKNGYVPGESINFTASINNQSKKTLIKVKVQLIQHLEVHGKRHDKRYKQKVFEIHYPHNIEAGGHDTWTDTLPIPALCQSFDRSLSKLIDLNYSVVLFFDAEFSLSKEVSIPITIGTYPCNRGAGDNLPSYANAVYKTATLLVDEEDEEEEGSGTAQNNEENEDDEKYEPLFLFYPVRN